MVSQRILRNDTDRCRRKLYHHLCAVNFEKIMGLWTDFLLLAEPLTLKRLAQFTAVPCGLGALAVSLHSAASSSRRP